MGAFAFAMHLEEGGIMGPILFLTIVIVLALCVIAGYAIWYWGPGLRTHSVLCPVKKKPAKVLADQRERGFAGSYAGLAVVDIKECSMFKGGPLECHKECLQRM